MAKYYRVRTQEQWDWLVSKLNVCRVEPIDYPMIVCHEQGRRNYSLIKYHKGPEPIIEVSQMMEESRMKDYVTIKGEDVEKLKNEQGDSLFFMSDKQHFAYSFIEGFDCSEVNIPKSLLYPKVPMTEAEKKEFDELKNEPTAHIYDLDDLLTKIRASDYPHLYHRLYVADGDGVERQLEFAHAWADESLIEVIPEKRWNVKVYKLEHEEMFYFKQYGGTLGWGAEPDDDDPDCQFTAAELKHYGLDGNLFEKVEVSNAQED